MTEKKTIRVLLVEDSPTDQELTRRALDRFGGMAFDVEVLSSTKDLRHLLETLDVDLLLLDYHLPGQTGLEFLRSLPEGYELPPVIVLTGSADAIVAKEMILAGAHDYFPKASIEPEALGIAIGNCLEKAARENEVRRQNHENERLAVIDALTDLYNRRYLADALRRECSRVGRYGNTLSCLMIDLDGFKAYNDVYGHLHGDAILRQVAALIAGSLRDCDIAARYGGDEFCVLVTETDAEGAELLAERLRASIAEQRVVVDGWVVTVTASIGVVTVDGRPAPYPEKLIEGADTALRRAKAAGKNRIHVAHRGHESVNTTSVTTAPELV